MSIARSPRGGSRAPSIGHAEGRRVHFAEDASSSTRSFSIVDPPLPPGWIHIRSPVRKEGDGQKQHVSVALHSDAWMGLDLFPYLLPLVQLFFFRITFGSTSNVERACFCNEASSHFGPFLLSRFIWLGPIYFQRECYFSYGAWVWGEEMGGRISLLTYGCGSSFLKYCFKRDKK